MRGALRLIVATAMVCTDAAHICAQSPAPAVDFHHVHLNVTEPKATIAFYQTFFGAVETKAIEAQLKTLKAPTLIVWGTDDVYFDVRCSKWLADNIPGTRRRIEFKGARIFFPEERWADFNRELRAHWAAK